MPFMDDFKTRLISFITDTCKMSNREFERTCGLTNGAIAAIGAQGPTASFVKKIADTYPELNLNWLFRGSGKMLITETPSPSVENNIHHNATVNINYGALKDAIVEAIKESKL